jgi:hypothetical protein
MVVLCRNFSRKALKPCAVQKERYAPADRNRSAEGEWIKRVGTDGLANAVIEILKRRAQASRLYLKTQTR